MPMQILTFILVLFSTCSAFSWNISEGFLREKCLAEPPEWMQRQIESDLAPFTAGITARMLERTLYNIADAQGGEEACLVRIKYQNGQWTTKTLQYLKEEMQKRLENFLLALTTLNQIIPLPDLDFLVSVADHYDRPLFLRETKAPVFTVCKAKSNHSSVLIPKGLWNPEREILFERVLESSSQIPWEDRISLALWRGSLSEGYYHYFDWDFKPRPILVFFSRRNSTLADARIIENRYFDAMNPLWKKWMQENDFTAPWIAPENQLLYRFLIAIDSVTAPDSLQWQLFSESTLLKAESNLLEWFYPELIPYVHYVPFRADSADLGQKIEWLKDNPEEAFIIAKNAKAFAEERLLDNSLFQYTYHLLKFYSTLLK